MNDVKCFTDKCHNPSKLREKIGIHGVLTKLARSQAAVVHLFAKAFSLPRNSAGCQNPNFMGFMMKSALVIKSAAFWDSQAPTRKISGGFFFLPYPLRKSDRMRLSKLQYHNPSLTTWNITDKCFYYTSAFRQSDN